MITKRAISYTAYAVVTLWIVHLAMRSFQLYSDCSAMQVSGLCGNPMYVSHAGMECCTLSQRIRSGNSVAGALALQVSEHIYDDLTSFGPWGMTALGLISAFGFGVPLYQLVFYAARALIVSAKETEQHQS